jgi:hypothetical protein
MGDGGKEKKMIRNVQERIALVRMAWRDTVMNLLFQGD